MCFAAFIFSATQSFAESPVPPEKKSKEGSSKAKKDKNVRPNYLRTALSEAFVLGAGITWYWIDRERQVADWDKLSWSQRLTLDVIRYDNNPFNINFAGHAFNGAGYHAIARSNGFGVYASVGVGLLTSLTWEYLLEFREKVSMNDLIFTTGVGLPFGEFFHVLGTYLSLDPAAKRASVAKWTAGLPMALAGALDGRRPASLASTPQMWHEMSLSYGLGLSSTTRESEEEDHLLHTLRYGARFVRLPGYREPGQWSRSFSQAEFTEASFSLSESGSGDAAGMKADTILLGHYQQSMIPGELSSSSLLGVSIAYEYRREQLGDWDDRVGVFHFPGLAGELTLENKGFFVELKTRLHYDFAGVNSLPNREWNATNQGEQGKAILRKMGYSFTFGPSARLSLEAGLGKISAGASFWAAYYKSDEGLDRNQEELTVDQKGSEEIRDLRLWLEAKRLPWNTNLRLEMRDRNRKSRLEEFEVEARLRRYTLELGLDF